jgi:hypothetical protein
MYGTAKRTDLIISSNNPVVADSLGAAVMGIPLKNAEHILVAEKEGLGSTNLENIRINDNWAGFKMRFSINKSLIDNISTLLFNNEILAKIVMDSRLTPMAYKIARFLRSSEERDVATDLGRYRR